MGPLGSIFCYGFTLVPVYTSNIVLEATLREAVAIMDRRRHSYILNLSDINQQTAVEIIEREYYS